MKYDKKSDTGQTMRDSCHQVRTWERPLVSDTFVQASGNTPCHPVTVEIGGSNPPGVANIM
jgi:hypothetical protein